MEYKIPKFVCDGAFNWMSKGYHYELSKKELLKVKSESDESPWYSIAHVVEQAKLGDFSKSNLLLKFFDCKSNTNVAPVAMLITGDLGQVKDLEKLVEIMKMGPDGFRVFACRAAANSGCMWLIPHMLEAWHQAEGVDAHENIGYSIADLLDPIENLDDMGPISLRAGRFSYDTGRFRSDSTLEQLAKRSGDKDASSLFHETVTKKYTDLIEIYQNDQLILWAGEARSTYDFAQMFLKFITSDQFNMSLAPLVISLRQKFEAATGIDCSIFFENNKFRQVTAAGVLEEFLDSGLSGKYQENGRFFFGHPIPQ